MSDDNSPSGGVGFASLLAIAFIVLKLCHVIDWSWWWVLSPLWIGVFLAVVVLGIAFFLADRDERRQKKRAKELQERTTRLSEDIKRLQKQMNDVR